MARPTTSLFSALVILILMACTYAQAQEGKWIKVDPQTKRYSVVAKEVSRGELLDELERVSRITVRPRFESSERITIKAGNLTIEEIVARLVPEGSRVVLGLGPKDMAGAQLPAAKKTGDRLEPVRGTRAKNEKNTKLAGSGNLKPASSTVTHDRTATGANTKGAAADLVTVAESKGPKKALDSRLKGETVRLTLQFNSDGPPAVIDAQTLEGMAPAEKFVMGPYLWVVLNATGKPTAYGTFIDPLEVHSYLADGQHSTGRADSGVVGISVPRESLETGSLMVVDLTGTTMPAVLSDALVRVALSQGKTVLKLDLKQLLRILDKGVRQ